MGKTSSAVKNRYNSRVYDQIALRVKKGEKDMIKVHAKSRVLSLNAYILDLVHRDIGQSP